MRPNHPAKKTGRRHTYRQQAQAIHRGHRRGNAFPKRTGRCRSFATCQPGASGNRKSQCIPEPTIIRHHRGHQDISPWYYRTEIVPSFEADARESPAATSSSSSLLKPRRLSATYGGLMRKIILPTIVFCTFLCTTFAETKHEEARWGKFRRQRH